MSRHGRIPARTAFANAGFDATGVRMTRLPMTPERVHEDLKAKGQPATGMTELFWLTRARHCFS